MEPWAKTVAQEGIEGTHHHISSASHPTVCRCRLQWRRTQGRREPGQIPCALLRKSAEAWQTSPCAAGSGRSPAHSEPAAHSQHLGGWRCHWTDGADTESAAGDGSLWTGGSAHTRPTARCRQTCWLPRWWRGWGRPHPASNRRRVWWRCSPLPAAAAPPPAGTSCATAETPESRLPAVYGGRTGMQTGTTEMGTRSAWSGASRPPGTDPSPLGSAPAPPAAWWHSRTRTQCCLLPCTDSSDNLGETPRPPGMFCCRGDSRIPRRNWPLSTACLVWSAPPPRSCESPGTDSAAWWESDTCSESLAAHHTHRSPAGHSHGSWNQLWKCIIIESKTWKC